MTNYNYMVLSPEEFERLSRDILQKMLGLKFESFTTGRDGGIDFRYMTNKEKIIVQCKRYDKLASLMTSLAKEVTKVSKLKPNRYIVTTTVGLTPLNKKEIRELFGEYIINESDIIGKNDLDNYVSEYKEIEKKFYKLWLSSVNILEKILHSKVVNQSELEAEKIAKNIELFVQNDSLGEAMAILKKNRFVLISGIPGIGKTTLARFLVYYLLGKGVDEFVYLSDSINDAFTVYDISKSQVFLFDDFLGKSNFHKASMATNEDRRIIDFIDVVSNSSNKYLIFTTREYILNQAKVELENFNSLEKSTECIIDLKKYNKIARGRIFYNHLFFYGLPQEYIVSMLENRAYLKIIDHENYSPRLIEYVTKKSVWSVIRPEIYCKAIVSYFNNPEEIWKHAYESQICELSRIVLAIMTTTSTPIMLFDLENAILAFFKNTYGKYANYTHFDFNKSIKELENTFIITSKDSKENIVVEFQNPSIHDFMCNYMSSEKPLLKDVIANAIYFNQLLVSFSSDINNKRQIYLYKEIEKEIVRKIIEEYEYLTLSTLSTITEYPSKDRYYRKIANSDILKLGLMVYRLNIIEYSELKELIAELVQKIEPENLQEVEIENYLKVLVIIKDRMDAHMSIEEIANKVFSAVNTIQDLDYFSTLGKIDQTLFSRFCGDPTAIEKINKICNEAFIDSSRSDIEDVRESIHGVSKIYNLDMEELINRIDSQIDEYNEEASDRDFDDYDRGPSEEGYASDDEVIDNIFNSLLE